MMRRFAPLPLPALVALVALHTIATSAGAAPAKPPAASLVVSILTDPAGHKTLVPTLSQIDAGSPLLSAGAVDGDYVVAINHVDVVLPMPASPTEEAGKQTLAAWAGTVSKQLTPHWAHCHSEPHTRKHRSTDPIVLTTRGRVSSELREISVVGACLKATAELIPETHFKRTIPPHEHAGIGVGVKRDNDTGWFSVERVIDGGPAEQMGLRVGDRLIQLNQDATRWNMHGLMIAALKGERGSAIELVVERGGKTLTLQGKRRIMVQTGPDAFAFRDTPLPPIGTCLVGDCWSGPGVLALPGGQLHGSFTEGQLSVAAEIWWLPTRGYRGLVRHAIDLAHFDSATATLFDDAGRAVYEGKVNRAFQPHGKGTWWGHTTAPGRHYFYGEFGNGGVISGDLWTPDNYCPRRYATPFPPEKLDAAACDAERKAELDGFKARLNQPSPTARPAPRTLPASVAAPASPVSIAEARAATTGENVQMCDYMAYTGEASATTPGAAWVAPVFYVAPVCGGVCCGGKMGVSLDEYLPSYCCTRTIVGQDGVARTDEACATPRDNAGRTRWMCPHEGYTRRDPPFGEKRFNP